MVGFRRLVGLFTALLGIAGVAACLAGTAYMWNTRRRVDDAVTEVSTRVDGVLTRLEDRAKRVADTIESAQDSVRSLNQRVQQRVSEAHGVPLKEAADIDELERQLYARIQLAGDCMGFILSTMDPVEQLMYVVESTPLFAQQETHTIGDLIAAVRDGRSEIQRYVIFQVWDFVGQVYDMTMYFVVDDRSSDQLLTHVMRTKCNAVGTDHLLKLMKEAGFTSTERLDGRFFQPVLVGHRAE